MNALSGNGITNHILISSYDVKIDFAKEDAAEKPAIPPVPLALQSLVTQTDASGKALSLAIPPYQEESRLEKPSKVSFLQRLFACCSIAKRKDTYVAEKKTQAPVTQISTSSSSRNAEISQKTVSTPISPSRRPAKFPDAKTIAQKGSRKCLALDLDETLVHSSFQPVAQAHYVIPVNIEGTDHNVYVIKRPGVDDFIRRVGEHYDLIVYTASLSKYADPLLDVLDAQNKLLGNRLFRENCVFHQGHYVKDLNLLNRDLSQTIIVDNSPMSYVFHPENAIGCSSFIDDPSDVEMWQIADFLVGIKDCPDVRVFCRHWKEWCKSHPSSAPH